jgi:hypothetical protein
MYDRQRFARVKQAAAVKGGSGRSREQAFVFFSSLVEKWWEQSAVARLCFDPVLFLAHLDIPFAPAARL